MKVTVIGAAGGIGQPLSFMLKQCPQVDELSLYDVVNVHGVAADLSHISTSVKVSSHLPQDNGLAKALEGTDVVLILAGVPRKPGMTRDDLFNINAGIVSGIAEAIAVTAPRAFIMVISNPVNSMVPIFASVLKKHNAFDPRRLFGVTTLDLVRASTFIAELAGGKHDPSQVEVPVIGGHSGDTIVPVFSQSNVADEFAKLEATQQDALINRVQYGGDEVVKAKDGMGSATLSMAFSAYKIAQSVFGALRGESTSVNLYVYLGDESVAGASELKQRVGVDFFSVPVTVGKDGIEKIDYTIVDKLSANEKELLDICCKTLKGNISKGSDFVINA